MVGHWSEEKGKLESQMEKLTERLENIKGRTNRQSKCSRDKINILANERQRVTVGEYKLETIQEINDEVADIERLSNFISKYDHKSSIDEDISNGDFIDSISIKKSSYHNHPLKLNEISIIRPKPQFKLGDNIKEIEGNTIYDIYKTTSTHGELERHKIIDDTLPCRLQITQWKDCLILRPQEISTVDI